MSEKVSSTGRSLHGTGNAKSGKASVDQHHYSFHSMHGMRNTARQRIDPPNMTKSISLSLAALALWTLPGIAAAQRGGASTYTEDRINQLRQSIADLENRAEQLRRQNQELQQKLDKMRSSYDSRLERLEKGGAAKAPTPRRGRSKP